MGHLHYQQPPGPLKTTLMKLKRRICRTASLVCLFQQVPSSLSLTVPSSAGTTQPFVAIPRRHQQFSAAASCSPAQLLRSHDTSRENLEEAYRQRGWQRRVLSKVFFKRNKKSKSLNMKEASVLIEEKTTGESQQQQQQHLDFVIRNLAQESQSLHPPLLSSSDPGLFDEDFIPPLLVTTTTDHISSEAALVHNNVRGAEAALSIGTTTIASTEELLADQQQQGQHNNKAGDINNIKKKGGPFTPLTRSVAQAFLTSLLTKWTNGTHDNLTVKCRPRPGNSLDFVRGHFRSDASIEFDSMHFPCLHVSNGRLEARRLALNLWSFTPDVVPMGSQRYPNQFDFVAKNMTFTEQDLFESKCIRNGLRRLVTRILRKQMITASVVTIHSIEILPSGQISVKGEASSIVLGSTVPFAVRTEISTMSRGHVIHFKNLEISLSPDLGLFVPVLPEVSLDLGQNAQLLDVHIDGSEAKLTVSAKATITPYHTLKLKKYIQSSGSFSSRFFFDVGRWLTRRISNEEHNRLCPTTA